MKTGAAFLLLAALGHSVHVHGSVPAAPTLLAQTDAAIPRVEVPGAKIRAQDILGASAPDVEIGPAPPIGSSRVVDRAEIERAFAAANITAPKKIPTAVRVSRKTRRLAAGEVATAIRTALAAAPLPRGAMLANVRAVATEVPADFERVSVDLPALPRRSGATTVHATVTFLGANDAPLQKTLTPLELVLPPEAAFPDIARGAAMTLIVRRGLVEVNISAVAATDGDVGGILPVTIKPSGRVLRARAIDKDHAVALEDS